MPQMSPLSWLLLMIIFMMMLIMTNTMLYFSKKYNIKKNQEMTEIKKMNWKW